ncbi:MAG TPA: Flp pilus assembly protein CpaB [Candidatus Nanopelagicales bacterium]|nr:Flp pilus assembly protein CpaB [Candidatus Nanopelagicales bacterium]
MLRRTPRPDPVPGRPPRWWRRVRRHRQLLAAGLVAVAVMGLASAVHPPDAATTDVVVARADLVPGTALTGSDLVLAQRPEGALPDDAVRDPDEVRGRLVAAPVHAGEVLRRRDVVGEDLLAALGTGLVAVPVRLADDGVAALLQPGDVVDLVSAHEGSAEVVAAGVRVLAVPRAATSASVLGASGEVGAGSLVVVAASTSAALALQRAQSDGRVGVLWRAGRST